MTTRRAPAWLLVLGFLSGESRADLPQIRLDRIAPLGGEAGGEVMLEIAGKDLDDASVLHCDHPGLKAELVKPKQFRVTIAADVPPGVYDVRAVGKNGISAGRLFAVSQGLTEVVEKEPNDTAESAQSAPLNAALNGSSDNNGDDYYRFPARKGQRITLDCQAFRLDSTLRAVLALFGSDGKVVARSRPYYDRTDPLLDVVIPADGEYVVGLHDATYSVGQPYRLVVSDRPQVESAFPNVVVPGETTELTLFGRNLPGGRPDPECAIDGLPLDRITVPFTAPNDPATTLGFVLVNPLPSANLNARGIQVRPPGLETALNPVTLLTADAPVVREHEPNDSASSAQEVKPPAFIAGRLEKPGDADWYTFTAKRGESLAIDLFCERIDRPGDLRVIVMTDKGAEAAVVDDHGIRFHSLDMYNRDPQGTFNVPADGTYRLLVQDTYNNGGPRYQYVLRLAPSRPDFFPVVFHETPSDPTAPVVRSGGSAFLEFCLNRRDGFNGPVTIEAEGLPPGVSCPPVHVSPQSQFADVVFTAAPDAPEWSGTVRLNARATIDGKRVERPVRCSQRRWAINNISISRACRAIALAVRPSAPYALKTAPEPATVAAGGTLETKVRVERHWPDFKGKVQINGLDLPPGFSCPATDLPADQTEAVLKFTVAANVPAGTYSVVLRGDAQVPYSPDPKVTNKPNVRVADPSTPLTVLVTEAPKK